MAFADIKTKLELEFVIFCIENVAIKLGVDARVVYRKFAEESTFLQDYIVPAFDALHTQGKGYIVNDLLEEAESYGVIFEGCEKV